jgi:fumarate reductase flavoprotein subunit
MAGLCAAARARELGLEVVVLDKGNRAGGSMRLSSGVIWRHRTLPEFRGECPGGNPELQATVIRGLEAGITWLESLGAAVVEHHTGNPRTLGKRFDTRSLTKTLVRAAGGVRLNEPLGRSGASTVILATGGFAAELAREKDLLLRANRWSDGDGLRFARARGAAVYGELTEFYGRAMPDAAIAERDFVPAAQLFGRLGVILDDRGQALATELSWSEIELPQALAQCGGRGWIVVDARAREQRVGSRSVAEMVAVAEELGGEVRRSSTAEGLGLVLVHSAKLREPPFTAVRVRAAVTHTIGGLAIDQSARVLDGTGAPISGLYAAGADVGGISTGGYSSGLAAALVLGRIAAESAAADLVAVSS